MRKRRLFWIVAMIAAGEARSFEAQAQEAGALGLTPSSLPIEITATPGKTMPGGHVTLSGTTGLVGDPSKVIITIKPPGSAPQVSLTTKPSPKGEFSVTFSATKTVGSYQVVAIAPDNKGRAATTFSVVSPSVVPEDVAGEVDSLYTATLNGLVQVSQALDQMPTSPAKQQGEAKLEMLRGRLKAAPAQTAVLRDAMTKVFKARASVGEPIPEWDEYEQRLADWQTQAEAAKKKLERLAAQTTAGAKGCADIERLNEMLTFASETMSLPLIPLDLSKSFWVDKIPGGLVSRGTDPKQVSSGQQFALVQSMKLGAAALEGPAGLLSAIPGLILDTSQYFVQERFAKFCVKFEGPLTGTFLGESFTRQAEPFFDYTVGLEGKIVLMYPKTADVRQPVALEGFIDGAGSFQIRDNPEPIARLIPGVLLFHTVTIPPGGGYWSEVSRATRSLLGNSFNIPLKGIMAGDSIILALQDAQLDFSEGIRGSSIWVIMPMGGLWPEVINSPIGIQNAHTIILRGIRRHPVLRIKSGSEGMVAGADFARDTTNSDRTARVRTKLGFKACNPGCLPLPLGPGSKPKN
jgi:hypothetical protein